MRTNLKKLSVGLLAFYCVSIVSGLANPTGGSVAAGSATIQTVPGTVTVTQQSNAAVINWQGFSIGSGEVTKFIQPGSQSAVLNRVVGGDPSQIFGTLQSNGKVFLINPNGILVGAGGRIDTGGFVASTLDISDAQFMSGGDLKFAGESQSKVSNLGTISASDGDIYLLGGEVENKGTLAAPNGVVGLAGGHQILLKRSGDEHLFVDPTLPGNTGVVTNAGAIRAAQAELKANGGNMYALAINNPGAITVTGVVKKNGHILLTAEGGTIVNSGSLVAKNANGSGGTVTVSAGHSGQVIHSGSISATGAKGTTGGQIQLLGDAVSLEKGSTIDASGGNGGGTVLVGGDSRGKNPDVMDAQDVVVENGAAIKADAVDGGNGGKVVAWSDHSTIFEGTISARGGAAGGNGGSAEVSGKETLAFNGLVNLGAPRGSLGTLLLDPTTITLHSGSGTDTSGANEDIFQDNLEAQTANIDLEATSGITYGFTMADIFTLTLQPNVNFTANVTGSGTLDLSGIPIVTSGTGAITLGSHSGPVLLDSLTADTGTISVTGANITVNSDVRSSGVVTMNTTASGTITLATLVENAGQNENFTADHLVLGSGFNDYIGSRTSPTGTLTLQPATAGAGMSIGGTKSTTLLSLGGDDLLKLKFASVHLGAPGAGAIAIHDAAVAQNIEFFGATQTIDNTFGANSLQFATGGVTTLANNANLNTFGGALTFDGGVVVTGNAVQLASNANGHPGGNVAFNSTIDGPGQLTVLSGGGTLTFQGTIGGMTPLSGLVLFAPSVDVALPTTTITSGLTINGDAINTALLPGNISQTGALNVGFLRIASSGTVELTNTSNLVSDLQTTSFGTDFQLVDSSSLSVDGHVTGGTNSTASIEVHNGSLNLQAAAGPNEGAQVSIQGAGNNLVLAGDMGVNNNVGASVLSTTNGARWVVYVTAPSNFTANGLMPTTTTSTVTFPTLPPNADGNTLVIGPIAGGTPVANTIQSIEIVAGASGTGADDAQLDDGQILFTDTAADPFLTISAGKLDSLGGNITLQAGQNIILDPNVNLTLTSSLAGSTVTFQTNSTQITLGGNLTTGGASLVLDAGNGDLTVKSLNTGAGTITLNGVGTTFANGSTLTGSMLSIKTTATNSGIGSLAHPVVTAVGTLDASADNGGIYITNSGQVLNIGGFNAAIGGVQAGAGAIQIINDNSIDVTDSVGSSKINGQANILVQANGATSDVVAANAGTSINAHAGLLTVQAGRDILIGNPATSKSGVVGGSAVTLNAGHSVTLDENSDVLADNGIDITAGTVVAAPDARPSTIVLAQTHFAGAQLGTRGGGISLVTAPGGFVDAHSGNTAGDIVTTLTAGHSNNIAFTTDDVNLATPINAGTSTVSFVTATTGLGFDLGTNHPANTASYPGTLGNTELSLTSAELNNITASVVSLNTTNILGVPNFSNLGAVTISAPVNIVSTHFTTLGIVGNAFTNTAGLTVPDLLVETSSGNIASPGALTISDATLLSTTGGDILLSGATSTRVLTATAGKNIVIGSVNTGSANTIQSLGNIKSTKNGLAQITIFDSGNLSIDGTVGVNPSIIPVDIETTGNLTISATGQVKGFTVLLATGSTGSFANNRGADAILPVSRFLVYQFEPTNRNGLNSPDNDSQGHFNIANIQPRPDPDSTINDFYYFGPQVLTPNLTSISPKDRLALLSQESGQPLGAPGVASPITQKNSYGLESLAAPVPGQSFLGFPPLPNYSLELQEAYQGGPNGPFTQQDMRFIMEAGGANFTPAQVGLLSDANKFFLASLGRDLELNNGTLKDPGNAIINSYRSHLKNGSLIDASVVDQMIKLGPMSLTNHGHHSGTTKYVSVYGIFSMVGTLTGGDQMYMPSTGQGVTILDASLLPPLGGSVFIPPNPDAPHAPLLSLNLSPVIGENSSGVIGENSSGVIGENSSGVIGENSSGAVSLNGGSVVYNNGGSFTKTAVSGLINQDGNGIINQDGNGLINQDGNGLINQDGNGLINQDGNGLINQDGNGLINQDGNGLINQDGNG